MSRTIFEIFEAAFLRGMQNKFWNQDLVELLKVKDKIVILKYSMRLDLYLIEPCCTMPSNIGWISSCFWDILAEIWHHHCLFTQLNFKTSGFLGFQNLPSLQSKSGCFWLLTIVAVWCMVYGNVNIKCCYCVFMCFAWFCWIVVDRIFN